MPAFNSYKRYTLLSGPKKSGKTIAALHRVCRHLWEVTRDKVAFIVKTQKSSKAAGAWDQLIQYTIPEWIAGIGQQNKTDYGRTVPDPGQGFVYTSRKRGTWGPVDDPSTKMPMFRIRNMHGTESECFLFSLNNDDDVIAKVFSNNFKMIYVSEVQNFTTDAVFSKAVNQLRDLDDPTGANCMWLGDTNPTDEGQSSWIYQLWYVQRVMENHRSPLFQKELALFEIFMEDNPTLTQRDYEEVREMCGHDELLFDRWRKGIWNAGGLLGRHFSKVWSFSRHVLGNASDPDPENWEVALPKQPCSELIAGFDLGEVNHSGHIIQAVPVDPPLNPSGLHYYTVLEELVYIGEEVSIEQFIDEFMAKIDAIHDYIRHPATWTFYSDSDAVEKFHAGIGDYYARYIRRLSAGQIDLIGVPRERGSVKMRVQMVKDLLIEDRLLVSAHCFRTIQMFEELRRGVKTVDYIPRYNHVHKHPFDSLSYGLQTEVMFEMDQAGRPQAGHRDSRLIQV